MRDNLPMVHISLPYVLVSNHSIYYFPIMNANQFKLICLMNMKKYGLGYIWNVFASKKMNVEFNNIVKNHFKTLILGL